MHRHIEVTGWTHVSNATQKPKYTTFPCVEVDISGDTPPATFPVVCKGSRKPRRSLCNLSPPLLIPQTPAVISGCVLGDSGGNNREANSPAHSSSCPHFKTSRRPSSIDPDLNPTLLSGILRRTELFITQHALAANEGETATQGWTREECKELERVQGWDAALFTTDSVFFCGKASICCLITDFLLRVQIPPRCLLWFVPQTSLL